jgi:hypothetical protein
VNAQTNIVAQFFKSDCEFYHRIHLYFTPAVARRISSTRMTWLVLISRFCCLPRCLSSFAIAAVVEALRSSHTQSNDAVTEISVRAIGILALDNANATMLGDCGACEGTYRVLWGLAGMEETGPRSTISVYRPAASVSWQAFVRLSTMAAFEEWFINLQANLHNHFPSVDISQ